MSHGTVLLGVRMNNYEKMVVRLVYRILCGFGHLKYLGSHLHFHFEIINCAR